jgi:putative hydrolase of the HAD superfamily
LASFASERIALTRAVIFDVDGVLIDGYHANPDRVRPWDQTMLADTGVDPDRFRQEFTFGVFARKVTIGQMGLVEALDRYLPSVGYRQGGMVFARYWLERDAILNAPVVDVARRLKARGDCALYIATNQEHLRAMWLWGNLGLGDIFDDMFYSARLGVRKPELRFFEHITRAIGPQTLPPLFVDDTPKVVDAARAHGWEAVLFDTLPDLVTHPWIAERLADLPKQDLR